MDTMTTTRKSQWYIMQVMVACLACLLCLVRSGIIRWTQDLLPPVASAAAAAVPNSKARKLFSPITDQEFDQCLVQLDMVAGSDKAIGMEEFILFLEMYSGRSLAFEDFQDVPTPLILIFFTAACSFGDGCDSENEPSISLEDVQDSGANGVLYTFCQSVKDVNAIQLVLPFEFQIRHLGEEFTLGEVLASDDGGEVIVALQTGIERVLLEQFGCIAGSERSLQATLQEEMKEAKRDGEREDIFSLRRSHADRSNQARGESTRNISAFSSIPCDYKVHASVKTVTPTVCLPDSVEEIDMQNHDKCALVSAQVSVTAASLYHHLTVAELRGDVVSLLNEAFSKDLIERLFG